jgi:hypothetical protein
MHFLLLGLMIPFVALLGLMGLFTMCLLVTAVLEFPFFIVLAGGLAWLAQKLSRMYEKSGVPCPQM